MTVTVADRHAPTSQLVSPYEFVALSMLIIQFLFTIYVLIISVSGKTLAIKSSAWFYSLCSLTIYIIWQVLNACLLYFNCPKIVSLLSACIAAILALINAFGLMTILEHFSHGSIIITKRAVKWFKAMLVGLHIGLVGPHYYLFRYYNTKNPDQSIVSIFQSMYQIYTVIIFLYMTWQFFYMAIYLKHFYKSIQDPKRSSQLLGYSDRKVSMKRAFYLLVFALVFEFFWLSGNYFFK
jgi:hypothetical protein